MFIPHKQLLLEMLFSSLIVQKIKSLQRKQDTQYILAKYFYFVQNVPLASSNLGLIYHNYQQSWHFQVQSHQTKLNQERYGVKHQKIIILNIFQNCNYQDGHVVEFDESIFSRKYNRGRLLRRQYRVIGMTERNSKENKNCFNTNFSKEQRNYYSSNTAVCIQKLQIYLYCQMAHLFFIKIEQLQALYSQSIQKHCREQKIRIIIIQQKIKKQKLQQRKKLQKSVGIIYPHLNN
ncbi:hypothetical protein TTHERM_001323739 (macronuclear) [Tetrahymena thermophila SB210]|uniref:Transmembrane protein n=1 Tax=Tetrahymena thermophila (strain SB210) TaxID=312017 RepID=W7XCT3_TETTS|nr:hypothetical protein TTHERM_001323739 [Tetrahymena thermophila SB210]EWS74363.1 hypothetical protein TTHERM_001323739 [Tetrahymena thermophila SB210]|eukprot:XP_012653106.1 hypothetical protein TTHERM_001323739 [Tetrahymena thermophila SB210]